MSADQDVKRDFSDELAVILPQATLIINSEHGLLEEALNLCMDLERRSRLANDFKTLKEVCLHCVKFCFQRKDWERLNATLTVISKKRAQSKVAITAIVGEAMTYISSTPNEDTKITLIKTLKEICEGKMYVEAESARLHLMLSKILEKNGDLDGACATIQDVHVETYGSLEKREKLEFILEQIRLNLQRKDYIRTLIQSRKMNKKLLEDKSLEDVKVAYYRLMIQYFMQHEADSWELSQCYYNIYDTDLARRDPTGLLASSLKSCVFFLLISKSNADQENMMIKLRDLKAFSEPIAILEPLPVVDSATAMDVTIEKKFANLITVLSAFKLALVKFTSSEIFAQKFDGIEALLQHAKDVCMVDGGVPSMDAYLEQLRVRILQHNIKVIAKYYSAIKLVRMQELLGVGADELESLLAELSFADLYLKIDRPCGTVTFGKPKSVDSVLTDWVNSTTGLLSLMEETSHMINKQYLANMNVFKEVNASS